MLQTAAKLATQMKAKGIMVFGDFNARNQLWGDTVNNTYGKEMAEKLAFQNFSIISSKDATFLSANGQSNIDFLITSNSIEHQFNELYTNPDVELFSGAPIRGHVPILTSFRVGSTGHTNTPPKIKIDIDSVNWERWTNLVDENIDGIADHLLDLPAKEQWTAIDNVFHAATLDCSQFKRSSVHSKPYWTKNLTTASKALKEAKKHYSKRNTPSNKEALDCAKDYFNNMRKTECQDFLLKKTQALNVSQCQKFWKQFNRMFAKKTDNKVQALWNKDGKDLQTEPCEMEETLFDNFFAGKHLRDKGSDFDDIFYKSTNKIYQDIMNNNADLQYESEEKHGFSAKLNAEITVSEIAYFIKQYKTSGKSFDNYEFHPLMLKHMGKMF